MARTRTLDQMVADLRYLADIEGLTDRHPDAKLQRVINESWQELRMLVSDRGSPHFLKAVSGTLTAGALTPDASGNADMPASFGTLDLPADFLQARALDIKVGQHIVQLEEISWEARNDWQDWWTDDRQDVPVGFFIYNIGTENTTTVDAGKIAVVPAPDSAYGYTLWYLPAWTDLTTGAHVFNGLSGWEQWALWNAVVKVAARDNDSRKVYEIALRERERHEERVLREADRTARVGPNRMQDTRGRRQRNRWLANRWLP